MVASFRNVFTTFALLGLIVLGTIGFIANLQEDNGLTQNIRNDSKINDTFNSLESSFNEGSDTANSSKDSFEADVPERGFGSLIVFAIVGVTNTFTGMITGTYNILIVLPATKLGIPKVVVSVINTILLISIVLLAWRVYRLGS